MGETKMNNEPDYKRYAALKNAWVESNPGASCQEYDEAIRRFAKMCGV